MQKLLAINEMTVLFSSKWTEKTPYPYGEGLYASIHTLPDQLIGKKRCPLRCIMHRKEWKIWR